MSQHLHSYLDAERLAECAKNDKALTDAERAIRSADAKMTASRYRVDAEWPGGGVSRTIPADTASAAQAWGEYKARLRADAVISVAPRFPMTYCSQCGEELGPGDAGVSHCDEHALQLVGPDAWRAAGAM